MKFRLEYSRDLMSDEPFVLKETGEIISGITFYVRFGTVFEAVEAEAAELKVEVGESFYDLSSLLRVSYEKEKKQFDFLLHDEYMDGYEIVNYFVDVGEVMMIPRECSKSEFYQIIQDYGHKFSTDHALQCCSYGVHEVSENTPVSKCTQSPLLTKNNNETFVHLEQSLKEITEKVESVPRRGIMAVQYRSSCLKQMDLIESTKNKKDWLLAHFEPGTGTQEIVDQYEYLINLYEEYYSFLTQEGVYVDQFNK